MQNSSHCRVGQNITFIHCDSNMVMCAVVNCNNNNNKKVKIKCSYFSFPKNKTLRQIWVQKCCQQFKFNVANARICSEHFRKDDYILKHRLLNDSPRQPKLKSDAVPSLNLPKTPSSSTSVQQGSGRRKKHTLMQSSDEFDKERSKEEKEKTTKSENVESMEIMEIDDENQVKSSVSTQTERCTIDNQVKSSVSTQTERYIIENPVKSSISTQTERFQGDEIVFKLQLLEAENFKLKEENKNLKQSIRKPMNP